MLMAEKVLANRSCAYSRAMQCRQIWLAAVGRTPLYDAGMPAFMPDVKTIGELLADPARTTSVPDYQRDYSWSEGHIDVFWQDLMAYLDKNPKSAASAPPYFIGCMVRTTVDGGGYLLLDGQQRLATAVILMAVIREHLRPFDREAAIRLNEKFIAPYDDVRSIKQYSLTLNRYDRGYFRRRVQDGEIGAPAAETVSERLIDAAYKRFDLEITKYLSGLEDTQAKRDWLIRLKNTLVANVTTVTVTCDNEDEAAEIFETINDRGLGLSTVDLLRNLILRNAGEPDKDEILVIWGDILAESLRVDVETFLRHYWTSRHGDIKSQRLYRAIRDYLKDSKKSSLEFMRDLGDAHKSYIRLLHPDFDDKETVERFYEISDLKAKMLYPLALSSLAHGESNLPSLTRASLTFYTRQIIVGRQSGSQTEDVVYAAAHELYQTGDFDAALKRLHEASISDELFLTAAESLKGLDTSQARYLLRAIEVSKAATEEVDIARQPRINVEHIYPQKPLAVDRWEKHNEYVNKLGNLTLLSRRINASIKNGNFEKKRPELEKSQLAITREVAALPQWTPAEVDARQLELASIIQRIWAWPQDVLDAAATGQE